MEDFSLVRVTNCFSHIYVIVYPPPWSRTKLYTSNSGDNLLKINYIGSIL